MIPDDKQMLRHSRRVLTVQIIGLAFVTMIASVLIWAAWQSNLRTQSRVEQSIALQEAQICSIASVLAVPAEERGDVNVQIIVDSCLRAAGLPGIHIGEENGL